MADQAMVFIGTRGPYFARFNQSASSAHQGGVARHGVVGRDDVKTRGYRKGGIASGPIFEGGGFCFWQGRAAGCREDGRPKD